MKNFGLKNLSVNIQTWGCKIKLKLKSQENNGKGENLLLSRYFIRPITQLYVLSNFQVSFNLKPFLAHSLNKITFQKS